jgi:hypothetical protein
MPLPRSSRAAAIRAHVVLADGVLAHGVERISCRAWARLRAPTLAGSSTSHLAFRMLWPLAD